MTIREEYELPDETQLSAAILAGGLGTRLGSVLTGRPKPLALINGRPFLSYLLEQVAAAGLSRAVLMTGHLAGQIEDFFGDSYAGLAIAYSQETTPLGTGGALRLALDKIYSRQVLVLNGDSFCRADYKAMWQWHQEQGHEATMLLTRVADASRYGQVNVNPDGLISSFKEKNHQAGPGWINAGAYLLERELIARIPASGKVSLEREIFPRWVGKRLYGYQSLGGFLDIGTPESLKQAQDFFSRERELA